MSHCYHCGELIPKGISLTATINQQQRPMCCIGCKAVAEYLIENQHENFYAYRNDSLPAMPVSGHHNKWRHFDDKGVFEKLTHQVDDECRMISIKIEDMYCNACSWLLNKTFKKMHGIREVRINALNKIMQVEFDPEKISINDIFDQISQLGYYPSVHENNDHFHQREKKQQLKRIAVAGFGMMFIMTLAVPLYSHNYVIEPAIKRFFLIISLLVATIIYFYSGGVFIKNALRDVTNKHLGMDVPIALSISIAYVVSVYLSFSSHIQSHVYYDSMAMFVFLLLLGRFVESQIRHQALSTRESMNAILPVDAMRLKVQQKSDNEPQYDVIPLDEIKKGDHIYIEAGQTISCDGVIKKGYAQVSEALLTGESTEIKKCVNDDVLAGSKLLSGHLTIEAASNNRNNFLSKLVDLMELAQSRKPQSQKMIDQIAGYFISVVLFLAAITFVWYWFYQPSMLLTALLSVLIATCPCALSLATPAALSASGAHLLKKGILVNNTDAITHLDAAQNWLFDKTGTLTSSQMFITKVHEIMSKDDYLLVAHAMQGISSHPVSSAFVKENVNFSEIEEVPSCGISAKYNQQKWLMGSKDWLEKSGIIISELKVEASSTVIYLSCDGQLVAAFELNMSLRDGAISIIDQLSKQQLSTAIISGDNFSAVDSCAKKLGVDTFEAEMDSEQKIAYLMQLQQQGKKIVMVGDGINDGPVLSQADVAISLKKGSALAHSASDFVLLGQSLDAINDLIKTSRKTKNIIKQNIIWSIVYNFSITPVAMMGYLQPWMAAIGMSVSSLIVVLNARRLL